MLGEGICLFVAKSEPNLILAGRSFLWCKLGAGEWPLYGLHELEGIRRQIDNKKPRLTIDKIRALLLPLQQIALNPMILRPPFQQIALNRM